MEFKSQRLYKAHRLRESDWLSNYFFGYFI